MIAESHAKHGGRLSPARVSTNTVPGQLSNGHFFFLVFFFLGTFAPFLRASDRPIAIACFRLLTFLPDFPLFNVPFFFLRIVRLTELPAFLPYFAIALPPSV